MFITGRYNGYPQAIDLDKITRVYVNENNEITVDGLSNTAELLYGIWEINGEELDVGDVAHRTVFMSYIVDYMASKFRKKSIHFELKITFLTDEDAQKWVEYVTHEENFNGVIGIERDTVVMKFHHPDEIKSFENLVLHWDTVVTYGIHKS